MSVLQILSPELLPYVLTAATMLALAAWLVWLDVASPTNRVLAAILLLRGLTFVIGATVIAYGASRVSVAAANLAPYLHIAVTPFVLYFLSIYPRRVGPLGRSRWARLAMTLATVGFCAWYFFDHSAYSSTVAGADGRHLVRGPLVFFTAIRLPVLAFAAWWLARMYARQPHGSSGYSLFLVAAGFAINATVDSILSLGHFISDVQAGASWANYYWMWRWLPLLALPLTLAALYEFTRVLVLERDDARLNEPRRFLLYVVPAAAVSASLVTFLPESEALIRIYDFVHGFWRLLVPFLITYALLRYSLFSIDIKVKAGVKRAIILTAFGLTFFVVSEAAEELFFDGQDRIFGLAAAMLLVLVSQPLQRGAQRAADALMPDTKPIAAMTLPERQQMYLEQYRLVEHDGTLTAKERRMLERLGAALGFSEEEAARLEQGHRETGEEAPPAVAPSASRAAYRKTVLAVLGATLLGGIGSALELWADVGDFAASLIVAGAITLLLAPLERLAGRITDGPPPPPQKDSVSLYRVAVHDALADGHWSRRERLYLDSLAERLGIDRRTRRSLHAQTRQAFVAQNTAGSRYSP